MKIFKLIILSLFISSTYFAQSFSVPKNYKLKVEADFEKYEQDAIACADWIMKTPLNEQKAKRAKAYKFLISYVSGSPKISATLNVEASPYIDNQDLLVVFLASWTKSCLQQNYANNIEEFTLRATDDVLKFYSKNKKSVGKAKKIKKFLKMQKKGTLHAYVKSKL